MLNDVIIYKKIKDGNIETFEKVFRQYYMSLYMYSFSIIGRKYIAEEIVQELFYVLWRDREHLNITSSLKNYLYGAVRNQSLQYCEHRQVQDRHKENVLNRRNKASEITAQEEIEYKELQNIINNTLDKLPERRRHIFKMHRMEGRKYKEIAEQLSVSIKTVEAEMSKAYQILRQEIEKYIHAS